MIELLFISVTSFPQSNSPRLNMRNTRKPERHCLSQVSTVNTNMTIRTRDDRAALHPCDLPPPDPQPQFKYEKKKGKFKKKF